jgi:hypothetical protein
MFSARWQHSAHSKTERQTDRQTILRNVSKTPHFRSWIILGVPTPTWGAISHNLTTPDFSLQCFLEPKVHKFTKLFNFFFIISADY